MVINLTPHIYLGQKEVPLIVILVKGKLELVHNKHQIIKAVEKKGQFFKIVL